MSDAPRERKIKVGAAADFHFDSTRRGELADFFSEANRSVDILALCGDMTTHGEVDQIHAFLEELRGVEIPIVAVLGNHDHEAEEAAEIHAVLKERGIHVLDGESVVIDGVGFAGVKGFAGGFGRHALGPFGERPIKEFVQAAVEEALKLERALLDLRTDSKLVLLHYAPISETLVGEPEVIWSFLGSSRLLAPIETFNVTAVFHGHAHAGRLKAETPAGIPVYNVALPVLRQAGRSFQVVEVGAPERRGRRSA